MAVIVERMSPPMSSQIFATEKLIHFIIDNEPSNGTTIDKPPLILLTKRLTDLDGGCAVLPTR
jgi:hypothetical protein